MKQYLFLLFFGVSAYGAAIDNSEITDDYSMYTPRINVTKGETTRLLPSGSSNKTGENTPVKHLYHKMKNIHNASRTGMLSFPCNDEHEKMILQSMGSSEKSYQKLLTLNNHAIAHAWPFVEQTVITQLMTEHPYATAKRPIHPKKRSRLLFWK